MARAKRLLDVARSYYAEFLEALTGYEQNGDVIHLYAAERLA